MGSGSSFGETIAPPPQVAERPRNASATTSKNTSKQLPFNLKPDASYIGSFVVGSGWLFVGDPGPGWDAEADAMLTIQIAKRGQWDCYLSCSFHSPVMTLFARGADNSKAHSVSKFRRALFSGVVGVFADPEIARKSITSEGAKVVSEGFLLRGSKLTKPHYFKVYLYEDTNGEVIDAIKIVISQNFTYSAGGIQRW